MIEGPTSRKAAPWLLIAPAVVLCIVLVSRALFHFAPRRIEGDTSAQRVAAVARLAAKDTPDTAEAIAEAAANDPDPAVRHAALQYLARFADEQHRPIVQAAAGDTNPSVRAGAAAVLGRYDDPAATARLMELAQDDDPAVCAEALKRLGPRDSADAIVLLVQTMERGGTPEIQQAAGKALARRFGMHFKGTPADGELWSKLITGVKQIDEVRAAFEQTNTPLLFDYERKHQMTKEHEAVCGHERDAKGAQP